MSIDRDNLEDVLDIESPEIIEPDEIIPADNMTDVVPAVPGKDDEHIDNEYQYAQKNLHDIIDKGQQVLDHFINVAKSDIKARDYEVVGSLVKTLVDANKDLLELKGKHQDLKGEKAKASSGPKNVTNAVFVGSTKELQKALKQLKSDT